METLHKVINQTCDKHCNMTEGQIQKIIEAVEVCVDNCAKQTRKLINECQPIKFL